MISGLRKNHIVPSFAVRSHCADRTAQLSGCGTLGTARTPRTGNRCAAGQARQLIDCPPEQREEVLAQAIESAASRTSATDIGVAATKPVPSDD